ncbi:hypothetical protein HOLleu_34419 [Holothuria leucospilota]|uniref:Ig-like domain-containing protein n=1 Tax=Holothuria leucospilota TaxID=206669 RepID=A0A9Q0YS45_HOLLE|nr:hypothetical protein HOLleu_34419 [Holothuria leucospilota]
MLRAGCAPRQTRDFSLCSDGIFEQLRQFRAPRELGKTCESGAVPVPAKATLLLTINWISRSLYCQGPEEGTHTEEALSAVVNSSVELQCSVDDYRFALWLFIPTNNKQPITLSSGDRIFNSEEYALSILEEVNITTYSLEILSVIEDMEGTYSCREQGATKVDITLLVEVPPSVWVEKDGLRVNSRITARIDETFDFSCVALGGRPTVSLSWNINDNHSLSVTHKKFENGTSSTLHYKPSKGDVRLSCITNGQIAAARVKVVLQVNVLCKGRYNTLFTFSSALVKLNDVFFIRL